MTITLGGPILPRESRPSGRFAEEIKRTQQMLTILILIVLGIHVISFAMIIFSLSINYYTSTYEPIINLCWILFFAVGLFVTRRYCVKGLLIFAWLGILNIVVTCVLIVFITVAIVVITSQASKDTHDMPFTLIPMVTCLTSVIFDAVIVIFAFKLWHLLVKNQRAGPQQRIHRPVLL